MIARSIATTLVVGLLLVTSSSAQSTAELLQKGLYTQNTVGDLDGAIRIYRQIVAAPSSRRADRAQAQARIVECFVRKSDAAAASRELETLARHYAEFKSLVSAAAAQSAALVPARDRVRVQSGPTRIQSTLGGTVTDDRGRPLVRAQIRLSSPSLDESRTASTDADGRYALTDLPSGQYTLLVQRSGFLPLRHGQRRPREAGKPLRIGDGEQLENVDFMLPRMSVISGRVFDETSEPIADAMVFAARSIYVDGRRQFVPTGGGPIARTNEDGEYRLVGLPPGSYLVRAQSDQRWTVDESNAHTMMAYAPTYFPGTTDVSSAKSIDVGLGKEAAAIDLSLMAGRTATISGTAVDSHGRPFTYVNVAFEIRGDGVSLFGTTARTTTVGADGGFSIANVPPGHYKLESSTQPDAVPNREAEVAIVPIEVDGTDLANVALVGSSGGFVSGRITADSGSLPATNAIHVILGRRMRGQPEPLMLGILGAANGFGRANLEADGTFAIDHVFGPARFDVQLPEGWGLQSIRHDGHDITDELLTFTSGEQLADLEIRLTRRITIVSGQVVGGVATGDGTVLVFATDREKLFENSRFVRAVRPDQNGQYRIAGLPPGEYSAIALDYVEQNAWFDPEFLESLRAHAQPLTLAEGENKTLSLTLVR
jgi:carboxypeptidase family protein